MVHGEDRGRRLVAELIVDPAHVEAPAGRPGIVESHRISRMPPASVDDVRRERRRVVVVAGDRVDGHRQRREQLLREGVLARIPVVGDVAGDDDRVRQRVEPEHRVDRGGECARGLVLAGAQMRIAELGENRHARPARIRRSALRVGGGAPAAATGGRGSVPRA